MSDRLPSAAEISIGTYYEQQHQQQQQQQRPSAMASAMAKSTMHFPSALQQRLHDYQSPSNGFAAPRYHSAAIAATAATAAAAGNYGPAFSPYGSLHYGGAGGGGGGGGIGVGSPAYGHSYADQHPLQQPHPHYDSIYNGRLIGGGAMSGLYGGRDRYFPYPPHHAQPQQQHRHAMRGMFTPAGQQLVPSSVLHYPPRGAAYQPPPPSPSTPTQQQQHTHFTPHQYQQQSHLQPQQQQQQRTSDSSLYARNEPQLPQPQQLLQLYPQRSPYLQMHLNGARQPSPTPTPSLSPATAPPIPSPSLAHNVRPAIVGSYNPYQLPHQQQQQPVASPSGVGSQQSALHEAISATHHQRQQQQQAQDQQQQQLGQMYTENRCNASSSDLPNTSEQSFTNADCKDEALFTASATTSCPTVIMPNHHSASTVSSPTNSTAPALGDCLTTSPPLISATGTDSGISSCSTRARSDSTQSTPVYSGEYPNSVGSSSGVSYHCADVKDFEEMSKEKEEPTVGENNAMAQGEVGHGESCGTEVKQEIFDNEDLVKIKTECEDKNEDVASAADAHSHQTESNAIKNVDNVTETASSTQQQIKDDDQTPNSTANQLPKAPQPTHNSSQVDAPGPESPNTTPTEAGNTSVSASGASMIASSADERSSTPSRQAPSSSPVIQPQQQQHSPALHQNAPNPICSARSAASPRDSSWPPFPGSPHSRQQQLEQSSPLVPVPPHNSPVDYVSSPTHPAAPTTSASTTTTTKTTAAPAATAATLVAKKHKNRIMECDLIPSKKSKRKPSSAEPASESDTREEMRDMTPLPGFQQAFGSTEIGRFFESFLMRPDESNAESVDTFDVEQQQQQQLQHHQQQLQHQQQQQQQHHYAADYLGSVYGEGGYHQRPHHHPAYYNRHAYAHSYHHHHLWPHARPSPYDPYEYGASRSGTAGGAAAVAPFNFHYGSGYSTMRDMLSLERMSYSYGRLNGGYGGIRCNGY